MLSAGAKHNRIVIGSGLGGKWRRDFEPAVIQHVQHKSFCQDVAHSTCHIPLHLLFTMYSALLELFRLKFVPIIRGEYTITDMHKTRH